MTQGVMEQISSQYCAKAQASRCLEMIIYGKWRQLILILPMCSDRMLPLWNIFVC